MIDEFEPLTVFIGANGVGKVDLFYKLAATHNGVIVCNMKDIDLAGSPSVARDSLSELYGTLPFSTICFQEPERGVHPWLMHKIMSGFEQMTKGGYLPPVQVLLSTYSPMILNLIDPEQVRVVELNGNGGSAVRSLPLDSAYFQAALKAFNGDLGEMWFTNVFGGNPSGN